MNTPTPRASRRNPSQHATEGLSLKTLAAAVCGVLGMGASSHAVATSTIQADTRATTNVAQSGNVFTVTTNTINKAGNTAFNSFSNFNVGSGDTVKLNLPGATTNLVNLVWNAQTVINGTVNSYLSNNKIGGAVYFADPNGIVVGSTGVLNVGALSLSAPTSAFMSSLLDGSGKVATEATAFTTLMQGQEPLADSSGTCMICVNGTINANNAVRIRASAIDVSGTVYVSGNGTDTLGTAVNVQGSSTPTLVMDGNTIRLDAEDSNSAAIGDSVASSSITVSGKLQTGTQAQPNSSTASASSWGTVALTAGATSSSTYSDPTTTEALKDTGSLLLDQGDFFKNGINAAITDANVAASDKLGQLAYVRSFSNANVSVSGTINAGGSVLLQSSTNTTATTDATSTGSDGSIPVMITGMYGAVFSKASTTIASGASITSGGQLSVQSSTDNTLNVAANTVANSSSQFAATTVAWSQAAVDAESTVNGTVSAGSLDIGAHNTNSFTTAASADTSNSSAGSVGIAGAVSLQTVKANASLDSSPTTNGNVTVASESDTTTNSTSASTGTSAADESKSTQGDSNADLTQTMGSKSTSGSQADSGKSFGSSLPFKLGSSVAWTDSDNAVTATIGNGVNISTAGNVAVQAINSDAGIHNAATADTSSEADSGAENGSSKSGSTVNVSAAVAYGDYQHEADAEVGTGVNITANNIGVGSQVIVPFDWTFGQGNPFSSLTSMGNSLSDFIAGVQSIPGLITTAKSAPDIISAGASGYASASASGSNVAIGGAVNYFGMNNTDRAWIGAGSTLKSTAAKSGNDSWQSALDWNTSPTTWAHSISVASDTELTAFNLVGDVTPWVKGTEGDSAAIGGVFNYGGYENSTIAGADSNVTLTSNNTVGVNATGKDTLIVLSPVSGKGGTASMQGTVALTDVDDHTHATLSGSDTVTAAGLAVNAQNPLMVWSLSGALAMSNSASVGISVGINSLTTDTLASIGNNSADSVLVAPDQSSAPTTPTGAAESGGTLKVGSLSLVASSSGESGALSVAGSSVSDPDGQSGGSGDGSSDKAADSGSGSGLLSMLQSVQSVTDKLRSGSDSLQSALGKIDELTGANVGGSSLLDQASSTLGTISSGDQTLQTIVGKVSSLGANSGASGGTASTQQESSFGLGISGAASVNMVALGTSATLSGITVDNGSTGSTVAVQAINNAQLASAAGGAALTRTKGSSGGGDLAGAVAYSSVGDTTAATVTSSTLRNASNVAIQALDGSEQTDVGVGVAVQMGGSGTSATLAGSVSVATSSNQTTATLSDSVLDGGSGNGRSLEVTAYDHSRIGIGAGSLDVNTGSGNSVNGSLAFTYANIGDSTNASITGHTGSASAYDIDNYDTLTLRSLDASQIAAGAATGSISPNGNGLTGAFIWNQIGNSTNTSIDGGARIDATGAMLIQANAVNANSASVSSLNSLIDAPTSASGYDFSGSGLAYTGQGGSSTGTADANQPGSSSLTDNGYGSSVIAVAGDISFGKNNVGLSFVGSQVNNTHQVSIGNASLSTTDAIDLQAEDNTRIFSLAVGGGISTGKFAGMGSATYNNVGNKDQVLIGSAVSGTDTASLQAGSVNAQAEDSSSISSLAGNVAVSSGNAAVGGAVTYNNIGNTISTQAGATTFATGTGAVSLLANDNASIMAGAVAAGGSKSTALMLSFGWNQTDNTTSALLNNGSIVTAGDLNVNAGNASSIQALSGSVGIGGDAAIGLAASIGEIGDTTSATLQDAGLNLSGTGTVQATGGGSQYSLAVAGSFSGSGAGAGSVSYTTISGNTTASASQLYGISNNALATSAPAQANALNVTALDSAAISSLSGGLGFSGGVGIGAAASISTIGGSTSASLNNSVLSVTQSTQVSASSTSTISTLSIGGSLGGDVAVSGSNTTNLITNSISASMTDDGTADGTVNGAAVNSSNSTSISASNKASINSLAGAIANGGGAAVGAAVAVNQIGTTTDAAFDGGTDHRTYKAAQLLVTAGASNPQAQAGGSAANITTIAVGAADGGDAAVAGSVAVNLLSGGTDARIDQGANVIAGDNVGVLASNSQGIDVLAGAAGFGGSAGVGVGVVINNIGSTTGAGIYNSNVTAYGNSAALGVDSGTLTNGSTLNGSVDVTGNLPAMLTNPSQYVAPNLADTQQQIHGVAVNATNQQYIATLGTGATTSGTVSATALAGVNEVGGTTTATVQNSNINQADYVGGSSTGTQGVVSGDNYLYANSAQQLDVRATSSQYETNLVADLADSGTVAIDGAVATNVFNAATTASLVNSKTSSQGDTNVLANGNQWSLVGVMGAAASGEVGGAASAGVTIFKTSTDALVNGGTLAANNFNLLANSATSGSQVGGALGVGIGTAGVAGTALVNVDSAETSATVENSANIDATGAALVQANDSNTAQDIAVTGAAGFYAGISGSALVNVINNSTHASVENSTLTAGSLAVKALDAQTLKAYSGGFGGGLLGVGGGINLSLLQANVGAGILGSTVDATNGNVLVDASSTRNLTSVAASAGAGSTGVGLSAGVVVAGSGDITDGGNANAQTDLNASNQVNLSNLSNLSGGNRVNTDTSVYGLDSSQLSSSDVAQLNNNGSFNLTGATGSSAANFGASDGVQATLNGGSVTAQNQVSLTAGVTNSTSNTAGAFAAGIAAAGGSLAYTSLNSSIQAGVQSGTSVHAGNGVSITASSGDGTNGAAASTNAMSGVGGYLGVSAAVAISQVNNTVSALDNGTISASTSGQGSLSLSATDSSSTSAGNSNISDLSIGDIVAGTVIINAQRSSNVSASLGANTLTSGFGAVNLNASDSGAVTAQAVMGAGGVTAAIDGVDANASDNSQVTASVGSSADITTGNTSLTASATPTTTASAEGITIAGGAGIGANVATAKAQMKVQALVGDNATFGGGNLGVTAQITPVVKATTNGGAGAALLGANAAVSTASNSSTVLASVGNDVTLPGGGVMIDALSTTQQTSSAQSITVGGVLALGAADASSSSNVTTSATLGNGNGTASAVTGNLAIAASDTDTNDASSEAGSGGLISGNAALASTQATSNTTASVGQNLDLTKLDNFSLTAIDKQFYGGSANSINAAAVGASGANVNNSANSTTQTSIGANSVIRAQGDVYVAAQSTFGSDGNNTGATGGAGGIAAGEAAGVTTTLTSSNTNTIGSDVSLWAGQNPNATPVGNLVLLADTTTTSINDQASLSVYGAVPIANAVVNLTGNFNSTLNVGDGSTLFSNNRLDLATYAQIQKVSNQASANTGGVATVGTSDATINLTSTQQLGVGNNVTINSVGEADIVAGKDILDSADTELNPSAVAQAYVRGLIAIPHASATANTTSNATLTLGTGSNVYSGGDVAIGAMSGTTQIQVNGTGHGYELGFIPATQNSNHQSSTSNASTTLNGNVLAGEYNKIAINIDQNGNVTDGGSTAQYQYITYNSSCGATASNASGGCFNPTAYLNTYQNNAVGTVYSGFANDNENGFILGGTLAQQNGIVYGNDLLVSGGNVYLYGSSIGGNGNVTANGAPSITINNASSDYLILPGMQVAFGSTGTVSVGGGASLSQLGNLKITQTPSSSQPSITVSSTFPLGGYSSNPSNATPGIVFLNEVDNLGGSVSINDQAGSVIESPIMANSVTLLAPNGGVIFDHPNENWFAGQDPSSALGTSGSWLQNFLNTFVGSPDNAAAAIANAVYGNGATNEGQLNNNLIGYNNNPGGAQYTPVILYGYCSPFALGGCSGNTNVLDGQNTPTVPYIALSQQGKYTSALTSNGSSSQIQTLTVTGQFININAAINVGTPATWTVQTTAALNTWISQLNTTAVTPIPLMDANGNPLLQVIGANSQLIGASYNPVTKQIILNNINASGGGEATFTGKIVSTGGGSINVNSGYGQVDVDNTTGSALVVNNIYTGSGGLGLITLVDNLKSTSSGAPLTTWYVSQNGQQAQTYTNANGATTWQNGVAAGAVTSSTTYQPLTGEEYVWSTTTGVNREGGSSDWSWGDAGSGTAGQHWSQITDSFVGSGGAGYQNLNGNDYSVLLSGTFNDSYTQGVWYHGCGNSVGSGCHYGTSATGSDPSDSHGTWHSEWDYIYPTWGDLTLNVAQRADEAINIGFSTSASNGVSISSNADILLNGVINNTNAPSNTSQPDTLLQTTNGGNIIQANPNALIWTHDLTMTTQGGGSIGSASDPIQARIVHDTKPGSTLTAKTDGGDIYINVDSGNSDQGIQALAEGVGKGANGGNAYGNVSITGTGSLVGIAGNARDVIGSNVNLVSTLGSIGSAASPLNVETHTDTLYNGAIDNGTLNAQAVGDIDLVDHGGDVWVGDIDSQRGNVSLAAPDGGIYDSRLLAPVTTLSKTQAQDIWNRLQLNSTGAAQGIATALQNQVNAAYTQYWQLLAVDLTPGGAFTLNPNAVALYWPLAAAANHIDPASVTDPAQQLSLTQAYVSARFNTATSLFDTYLGSNWQSSSEFTRQDPSFSFVIAANSTLYQSLLSNTQWSADQLTYAINVAALAAPSGAQVGTVAPNISGANITLTANAGGIGQTAAPIVINYQDFKNLYTSGNASSALQQDVLALGLANAPGDVQLLDAQGNTLQPTDPTTAQKLSTISIAQTNPLYLTATGAVSGSASGSVYVQANGDLNLGGLSSGSDMRLAATGSINAATGSTTTSPVLTTAGNLVLSAGGGHISFGNGSGTSLGDALPVQIGGVLLSGSAQTDLLLSQLSGDLRIDSVFGNGTVSLAAVNGSILSELNGLNIEGNNIVLNASGDIGQRVAVTTGVDAPLQVQVGSTGVLNANAGGEVDITSPLNALQVGTIDAGGNLTISAQQAPLTAQQLTSSNGSVYASAGTDGKFTNVQAADNITLTAAGQLNAGSVTSTAGLITLDAATGMTLQSITAQGGNIVANLVGNNAPQFLLGSNGIVQASGTVNVDSSGSLDMGQGSSIGGGGTVTLTSTGDMQLGLVQGNATQGMAISLNAGGAISSNGAAINLQARQGGNTSLLATNDIGSAAQPLVVDVSTLSGSSTNGNVWLHAIGDIDVTSFTTPLGSLNLNADQDLTYTTLQTGQSATLSAGQINGGQLTTGTTAQLTSSGSTTLASVITGGDLDAHAGTTLGATTLTVGGNGNLISGGTMTLGQVTTVNNLVANAGGDLDATTLGAGAAMTLTAAQAMNLGNASAAGDVQATAGSDLVAANVSSTGGNAALTATNGDLSITQALASSGNTTLSAGKDSSIASLTTGGALVSNSGGNTQITQGKVSGTSQLDAGGNLTLASFTGGNTTTTQSGGDTQFGKVQISQGNLQGKAGGALDVTQSLAVQSGNAALQSGTDMSLLQAIISGTLGAQAGGDLQSSVLQVGGNGSLSAGGAMTLSSSSTGGNLTAQSGGNLQSTDLQIGGDGSLTSGAAMALSNTITRGSFDAQSVGDLQSAVLLQIGSSGNLTSGGAMVLGGQTTTGSTLTAKAGGNLQANTLQIGSHGNLTSGGAMALDGNTTTGGTLSMQANGHLGFASIESGSNVFGQSFTSGIDGNSVTSGGSIRFIAPGDINIGTQHAATDIDLQAGGNVVTQVADAGGNIDVSAGGNIGMGSTQAAGDITLQAGGNIDTQVTNAGNDISYTANGNIGMGSTQAGNGVSVDAGGTLTVGDMQAGQSINLAAGQVNFTSLTAPSSITLLSRAGNIFGASLTTLDAFISASGSIDLDAAYIGDRINLAATDITANITQTSSGQPLYSSLTGYQGGVAQRITVDASAAQDWMIDRLAAVQAALASTGPNVDIQSGHIEQIMSLDTADAHVRMNQHSAQLVPANVQLMQPGYDFALDQDGNHTLTNAFVIRYDYGYAIQTPNYVASHFSMDPDYLGESALRNNGRYLQQQDDSGDDLSTHHVIPAWSHSDGNKLVQPAGDGVAVNIKAPE